MYQVCIHISVCNLHIQVSNGTTIFEQSTSTFKISLAFDYLVKNLKIFYNFHDSTIKFTFFGKVEDLRYDFDNVQKRGYQFTSWLQTESESCIR